MPSLNLESRLIWFAHCPKAGGTSVEQFMVARWGDAVGHLHWGWDIWWRQGGWRMAQPPNSPQHLTWEDALESLPAPPDMVFALVRDPAARMASEHRWQRRGRRGTIPGKLLASLPFSLWLRVMLAAARMNPHAFDNHFRPQTEFVPDTARVFRLEDGIEPVLCWLAETAGDPVGDLQIPHAIPTGRVTRVTPADRALIEQVFEMDYRRFGYPMQPPDPGKAPLYDRLARVLAPGVARLDRRGRL